MLATYSVVSMRFPGFTGLETSCFLPDGEKTGDIEDHLAPFKVGVAVDDALVANVDVPSGLIGPCEGHIPSHLLGN